MIGRTTTGQSFLLRNLPLGGFAVRSTGCGDLAILHWGLPVRGSQFGLAMWGSAGFRGFLVGWPTNTPLPQCPGCTVGVNGDTVAGDGLSFPVPNVPFLVGLTFAFQGFDLGSGLGTNPCLGALRFSDAVDVTLR